MISDIPIKTSIKKSEVFSDFFLVKSAVQFKNFLGNSQLICGFGFNEVKELAEASSRFEVLEHLYATYDFQQESIRKNSGFSAVKLNTQTERQVVTSSSVLTGPVPDFIGSNTDANGLGSHVVYKKALEHALLEVIERDCLARLWYEDLKIIEVEDACEVIDSFRVRFFVMNFLSFTPVIAIVNNPKEGIWALGSAVRYSLDEALQHSKHEAMMLIEGSLIENGFSYSRDIEKRILSLKNGQISLLRETFVQSKISGHDNIINLF